MASGPESEGPSSTRTSSELGVGLGIGGVLVSDDLDGMP